MTADPLEVHAPFESGEMNLYSYVSGAALKAVDPLGLCGEDGTGGTCNEGGTQGASSDTAHDAGQASVSVPGSLAPYSDAFIDATGEGAVAELKQKGTSAAAFALLGPVGPVAVSVEAAHDFIAGGGPQAMLESGSRIVRGEATPQDAQIVGNLVGAALVDAAFTLGALKLTMPRVSVGFDLSAGRGRLADPGVGPRSLPEGVAMPAVAGDQGRLQLPRILADSELAALMNTSGGIEVAQSLHLPTGTYWLSRADTATPNRVAVPTGRDWVLDAHTHPNGSGSSPADRRVLLFQSYRNGHDTSRIVRPDGTSTTFTPSGDTE